MACLCRSLNAGKCILSESEIHDFETFLEEHAPRLPLKSVKNFLSAARQKNLLRQLAPQFKCGSAVPEEGDHDV